MKQNPSFNDAFAERDNAMYDSLKMLSTRVIELTERLKSSNYPSTIQEKTSDYKWSTKLYQLFKTIYKSEERSTETKYYQAVFPLIKHIMKSNDEGMIIPPTKLTFSMPVEIQIQKKRNCTTVSTMTVCEVTDQHQNLQSISVTPKITNFFNRQRKSSQRSSISKDVKQVLQRCRELNIQAILRNEQNQSAEERLKMLQSVTQDYTNGVENMRRQILSMNLENRMRFNSLKIDRRAATPQLSRQTPF